MRHQIVHMFAIKKVNRKMTQSYGMACKSLSGGGGGVGISLMLSSRNTDEDGNLRVCARMMEQSTGIVGRSDGYEGIPDQCHRYTRSCVTQAPLYSTCLSDGAG